MHPSPHLFVLASATFLFAACATTPPISELRSGINSASFIQLGAEPLKYEFGVVGGKSFWASAEGSGLHVTVPGISAATAVLATAALNAGVATAEEAVKREEPTIAEIMKRMLDGRPFVGDITQGVMPAIARAWGVPYQPNQLQVRSAHTQLASEEEGIYLAKDPNTDMVVVFSVNSLKITEKPSVGGLLSAVATIGFNDKEVAPEVRSTVTIFKRDIKDRLLKRVWNKTCVSPVLFMPVSSKFSEITDNPNKARALFDGAVQVTIKQCVKMMENYASN